MTKEAASTGLNKFQKLALAWERIPKPLAGNKKGYKKGFEDGFLTALIGEGELGNRKTVQEQVDNLKDKSTTQGYSGSWIKRLYRLRETYKAMCECEANPLILKGFKMALDIFEE